MGRLPTIFTNYGDDKHVVIPIEFAKDESSILSTSNKQGQQKLAFFIGGEQGKFALRERIESRSMFFGSKNRPRPPAQQDGRFARREGISPRQYTAPA